VEPLLDSGFWLCVLEIEMFSFEFAQERLSTRLIDSAISSAEAFIGFRRRSFHQSEFP
jgi:hypothetical protein